MVKNIVWLSVGQIGSRFIRAAIIIYAARVLGAAEYGLFSYALGLAGFFTIFADVGINAILTREVSQKPEKASEYFATSFWIKTTLIVGTGFLVILVAPYFSKIDDVIILLPFVALLTLFDNLREFTLSFFRAKEKMEIEALVNVFTNISITLFGFFILSYIATAQAMTVTYAISAGTGALLAIILLRNQYKKVFSHFDFSLLKPIIQSALPIAVLGLFGVFMLNIDMVMLGWWRTTEEIGFYSAGQKIVQVLYTLPSIIAAALFPTIARLVGQKNDKNVSLIMSTATVGALFLAIPLTIGGIVLAKSIILFLYGSSYLPSTLVFQILVATTLFVFPGTLFGNFVLAYNKQKKFAKYVAIASIGNVVFNALLIPKFGIIGAATATIIVQSIYNAAAWLMVKKINNFHTLQNIKRIIFAGVIMGVTALILDAIGLHVIINIVISAGMYMFTLFILKEPLILEVKNFIAILRNNQKETI
ncbi:MAG: flippase [Candidatus Woesearchaeota archaeon]